MGITSSKLFVEKSIDINASPSVLWKVLTDVELNPSWIEEWWPDVSLLSSWEKGSPVIWKYSNGDIGALGDVKFVDPEKVIRFSFIVNGDQNIKEEMTFVLHWRRSHTHLTVTMGDFGDSPEHFAYYSGANESWSRALPKIKFMAENITF